MTNLFERFNIRAVIAITYILLCFVLLFTLVFVRVPEQNKDVLTVLTGAMFANLPIIVKWYFETSKDKSDKDQVQAVKDLNNA